MLFYRAALPLSSKTLNFTAGVVRRHLRAIGSRWRRLSPGQQALLVLAYLRKGETFADLAAGLGVGTATGWRYVNETVALLAARAPRLRKAAIWGVLHELEAAGLITLADKGYQGSTHAKIPYRGKNKTESQKEANRAHAKLRAPGERANALLKNWRILRKLRCCPWRAGQLAKAIHALEIHAA